MDTRIKHFFAMLCATGLLAGCGQHQDAPQVRTYPVTGENADQIASTLKRVLTGEGVNKPMGQVSLLPDGTLIVVAPPSVQVGIGKVIEQTNAAKPARTRTFKTSYWLIKGEKSADTQSAPLPEELRPVGEAITNVAGPQKLELVDKAQIAAVDSISATISSVAFRVNQRLQSRGDRINCNLDVRASSSHEVFFETVVQATLNHPVVIGMMADQHHAGASLYFVLQISEL